jgi:hypothetical protein
LDSFRSASDVAQAAQQSAMVQVAQLNAQLEAERARGEMALRLQEAEHAQKMAAEASSGRMSGDCEYRLTINCHFRTRAIKPSLLTFGCSLIYCRCTLCPQFVHSKLCFYGHSKSLMSLYLNVQFSHHYYSIKAFYFLRE